MHLHKSSLLLVLNRTFLDVHWSKGCGDCESEILSFMKEAQEVALALTLRHLACTKGFPGKASPSPKSRTVNQKTATIPSQIPGDPGDQKEMEGQCGCVGQTTETLLEETPKAHWLPLAEAGVSAGWKHGQRHLT